ncbi:MAG: tilS [Acidimicrobiaceae bacterium]|nr:tilS [Acidimicrobiaceae bacterium]
MSLAVSGGPDSLGLLLLAVAGGLTIDVHHVDHHARVTSGGDARFVEELCRTLAVPCVVHDVEVHSGANFEARARAERRRVLPDGALTGHTMDDLVETVLLNMMRGAGVDGLSPMVNDPTKPLRGLRRSDLHDFVEASGYVARHDESNDDMAFRRNRVRHQLLPLMCEVAERDVVPVIARQAGVLFEERSWIDALSVSDATLALSEADCRQLRLWPRARLRRWLRRQLGALDDVHERHPPSAAEVERALAVVVGDVVATELSGGRRLARRDQRLVLEDGSTTLTMHG